MITAKEAADLTTQPILLGIEKDIIEACNTKRTSIDVELNHYFNSCADVIVNQLTDLGYKVTYNSYLEYYTISWSQ